MDIIGKRKIWFTISSVLVITSVILWLVLGMNLGIDFTGGIVVEYKWLKWDRVSVDEFKETVGEFGLEDLQVQLSGDDSIIIKAREMDNEKRENLLVKLNKGELGTGEEVETTNGKLSAKEFSDFGVEEERFELIGPTIGKELREKSIWAIVIVALTIVVYIAYTFRKVGYPVASWKYGIAAIVALVHDILITLGVFVVLGYFLNVEINTLFVVALLTILGYSVNDTIVVFDRVRDNVLKEDNFEKAVNKGLQGTIIRSLNTSITTFLVLFSIFLFGGDTIRWFIFALMVGIIVGTYSSIFVASPVLVLWKKLSDRKIGS